MANQVNEVNEVNEVVYRVPDARTQTQTQTQSATNFVNALSEYRGENPFDNPQIAPKPSAPIFTSAPPPMTSMAGYGIPITHEERLERCFKWLEEMVKDHHTFYLLDFHANHFYIWNKKDKECRIPCQGKLTYYLRTVLGKEKVYDEIFNLFSLKIYVINEKLKRHQREGLTDVIYKSMKHDYVHYYLF